MPERPTGIDPRGPRFAASITAVLLVVAVLLGLTGLSTARSAVSFGWFAYQPLADTSSSALHEAFALPLASISARILDPAFLVMAVIALLFLWGVAWPRTAPWGALYRSVIQPRLAPATDLEDPRPPRFAQGVGLFVTGIGLVLHLLGVPWALPIAAAIAFIAAFLNAVFGICLGCLLYLALQRAGLLGRASRAAA